MKYGNIIFLSSNVLIGLGVLKVIYNTLNMYFIFRRVLRMPNGSIVPREIPIASEIQDSPLVRRNYKLSYLKERDLCLAIRAHGFLVIIQNVNHDLRYLKNIFISSSFNVT